MKNKGKRMKKLSAVAMVVLLGNVGYAGGEFSPVTSYEIEDTIIAEEAYIEDYVEPVYIEPMVEEPVYIEPKPVYIEPKPVVLEPKPIPVVVVPKPVVAPKKIVANGFYAGLGITGVRYENNCRCPSGTKIENKDKTYGGVARVGYDFNQYIGVEARASKTNWDSDGSKVEHIGIFVKPMMPVSSRSNVYGLIGVAKTKVTGSLSTVNSEALALGTGIEIDLSKDIPREGRYARPFDGHGDQETGLGLFVDYERMVVKSDAPDIDAVSAGITYDF